MRRLPWPTETALKAHFKRRFVLHSQTTQGVIERFCGNVGTTRTNRANGDRTARYPHRAKAYMTPVWKGQAVKRDGHRLVLPMGRGRKPLQIRVPDLPTGKITTGRWKRLTCAIRKRARKRENVQRNALHHVANIVGEFVVERDLGAFHIGEITEMNRGKRHQHSRRLNQEVGDVPLGQLVAYLGYRLAAVGCKLEIGDEAYTSQTCPVCGQRTKPRGRLYACSACRFTAARDQVGCWNILNKSVNGLIKPGALVPHGPLKYLRPVKMQEHRKRSGVVPLAPGTLLGTTHPAEEAHASVSEALGAASSAA